LYFNCVEGIHFGGGMPRGSTLYFVIYLAEGKYGLLCTPNNFVSLHFLAFEKLCLQENCKRHPQIKSESAGLAFEYLNIEM
jgi:hypothetical protein